jgi:hypothetical protein
MSALAIVLTLVLALQQVADVLTTRAILRAGGFELFASSRWAIERTGFGGWLAMKLALCAVMAFAAWPFTAFAIAAYGWWIFNNFRVLARLKRKV